MKTFKTVNNKINIQKYKIFIHHHSNLSPGIHLYKIVQNSQSKVNLIFQEKTAVDYLAFEANKTK